jgi:HEAT repeat protein
MANVEPVGPVRWLLIVVLAPGLLVWAGCESKDEASARRRLERQIRKLKSDDPEVSRDAAIELGNKGPDAAPAVDALIEALSRSEDTVRRHAAYALGKIGPAASDAIEDLEKLLDDDDLGTRVWAVQSLVRIDPDADPHVDVLVDVLATATGRTERSVCINVAGVVEFIGERAKAAVPALIARLHEREFSRDGARALGAIGPAAASAIGPLERLTRSPDPDVVAAATEALAKIRK